MFWSLGPGDLEGTHSRPKEDREVDGDCGPLDTSQLLVRDEGSTHGGMKNWTEKKTHKIPKKVD